MTSRNIVEMRNGIDKAVARLQSATQFILGFFRDPDLAYILYCRYCPVRYFVLVDCLKDNGDGLPRSGTSPLVPCYLTRFLHHVKRTWIGRGRRPLPLQGTARVPADLTVATYSSLLRRGHLACKSHNSTGSPGQTGTYPVTLKRRLLAIEREISTIIPAASSFELCRENTALLPWHPIRSFL